MIELLKMAASRLPDVESLAKDAMDETSNNLYTNPMARRSPPERRKKKKKRVRRRSKLDAVTMGRTIGKSIEKHIKRATMGRIRGFKGYQVQSPVHFPRAVPGYPPMVELMQPSFVTSSSTRMPEPYMPELYMSPTSLPVMAGTNLRRRKSPPVAKKKFKLSQLPEIVASFEKEKKKFIKYLCQLQTELTKLELPVEEGKKRVSSKKSKEKEGNSDRKKSKDSVKRRSKKKSGRNETSGSSTPAASDSNESFHIKKAKKNLRRV